MKRALTLYLSGVVASAVVLIEMDEPIDAAHPVADTAAIIITAALWPVGVAMTLHRAIVG